MLKLKNISFIVIALFLVFSFSVSLQSLLASWTAPTTEAPGDNVAAPLNTSAIGQLKKAGLVLNGGSVDEITQNGLVVKSGRAAIATSSANATLDVNGEVKIGNSGVVCSNINAGSLRFNSINISIEFCANNIWTPLVTLDINPDAFSFPSLANQNLNTSVSTQITPTGYDSATVTVSGQGNPQISCNGGSWVSSCNLIKNQSLQLRLTTASSYSTAYSANVAIGGISASWSVTTMNQPVINGSCGSSNGGIFASAPTSGFCNSGSYSGMSGSGPWSWTCNGSGGGSSVNCSALNLVVGGGSCYEMTFQDGSYHCGGAYRMNGYSVFWAAPTWSAYGVANNGITGGGYCQPFLHANGHYYCDSWNFWGSAGGGPSCSNGTPTKYLYEPYENNLVGFICSVNPCNGYSLYNTQYGSAGPTRFECRRY